MSPVPLPDPEVSDERTPAAFNPGVDSWTTTICASCGTRVEETTMHCPQCGSERFRELPDPRDAIDRGHFLLKALVGLAVAAFLYQIVRFHSVPLPHLAWIAIVLGCVFWARRQPEPAFATLAILFGGFTLQKLGRLFGGELVALLSAAIRFVIALLLYQAWRAARRARQAGITVEQLSA